MIISFFLLLFLVFGLTFAESNTDPRLHENVSISYSVAARILQAHPPQGKHVDFSHAVQDILLPLSESGVDKGCHDFMC